MRKICFKLWEGFQLCLCDLLLHFHSEKYTVFSFPHNTYQTVWDVVGHSSWSSWVKLSSSCELICVTHSLTAGLSVREWSHWMCCCSILFSQLFPPAVLGAVLYFALRGDNKTSSTWSFSSLYSASRLPDNLLAMIRVVESGGSSSIIYLFAVLTLETLASCSVLFYFLSQSAPKTCFLSSTTITKKVTIFLTLLLLPLVCKVVAAVNNSKTV